MKSSPFEDGTAREFKGERNGEITERSSRRSLNHDRRLVGLCDVERLRECVLEALSKDGVDGQDHANRYCTRA